MAIGQETEILTEVIDRVFEGISLDLPASIGNKSDNLDRRELDKEYRERSNKLTKKMKRY